MDAGLTQRALAARILAQHGDYLMVVKRNQRQLYEDLALYFHAPPLDKVLLKRIWLYSVTMLRLHESSLVVGL